MGEAYACVPSRTVSVEASCRYRVNREANTYPSGAQARSGLGEGNPCIARAFA